LRVILDGQGSVAAETPDARSALGAWSGCYTLLSTVPDWLTLVRTPAQGGQGRAPKVVLTGDASGFPLPDLIAFLSQSRWGGTVKLFGPEGERSISLKEGEVRNATSDDPADRLGEVIVRLGYLKREQLEQALQEHSPSKVGRALVDAGLLQAHDLYRCVQHQVSEIFHAMVLCKEGTFALVQQEPDEKGGASLQISTQSLLMDSIRMIDELAHFRRRIPHGRVYVVGKRPADGTLEDEEAQVLGLVTGTRTVLELGQAAKLSEFDVTKVVFRLFEGGYVALADSPVGGGQVPAAASAHPAPGAPAPLTPAQVVGTFNQVFQEILVEVGKQAMAQVFLAAANAALSGKSLSSSPVLVGLTFEPTGTLPERALLERFERLRPQLGPLPVAALRQALSDVMFFLLFQAGELLEARADEELAKRVKEMLALLGE
jgi:hypothetical protein